MRLCEWQSLMYHGRVKQHDWLQSAFAFASGAIAYYLWTLHPMDVRPDWLVLSVHEVGDAVGDWVRRVRAAFR